MSQPTYQALPSMPAVQPGVPRTEQWQPGVPHRGSYGLSGASAESGFVKHATPVMDRPQAAVEQSSLLPKLGESGRRPATDDDDVDEAYLREYVRADFEDVIHEIPGTQVFDACNLVNKLTFTWSKVIWYHIFSLSFGVFLSFWWGFWFAMYSHFISWWWYPFYRLFKMTVYMWAIVYRSMCRAFMHPLYEAVAMTFSNVHVTYTHKGTPQAPISAV